MTEEGPAATPGQGPGEAGPDATAGRRLARADGTRGGLGGSSPRGQHGGGVLGGRPPRANTSRFGALLAPVPMRTAGERIAERIVTAIALGEFVPGQRLPTERELAAMLEVSRTTVREALQRLQASGYVTTKRGRGGGTFVRTDRGPDSDEMIRRTLEPAWAELTEILDFRSLVEQLIARTAAQRRDDRRHRRDPPRGRRLRPGGRPGGVPAGRPRAAPGDRAGHAQRAPGRPQRAGSAARSASASTPSRTSPRSGTGRCDQHPELAEAVIAGDQDRRGQLAAEHFSLTEDMLTELHARISLRSAGRSDARSQGQ